LRRGWRKAAPLLLFASLLPGLSAIDHWGPGAEAEPMAVAAPAPKPARPAMRAARPAASWHRGHMMSATEMATAASSDATAAVAANEPAEPPDDVETDTHVAHCHYQPSSCSDQPLTPNANAFPGIIELPSPALTNDPLYDSVTLFEEFLASPPDQPPKSA
jgi:hypothetical protein